ncbi:MAG: hypothetical protein WC211_02445 [Dehalococcoidia bacterium]
MRAILYQVQPYELHGTLYYALRYLVDGQEELREARISHDMAYATPAPGDRVEIHALLGIVDRVTKIDEG